MKLNKILALTAVFATLFALCGTLSAQSVAHLYRMSKMSEDEQKAYEELLRKETADSKEISSLVSGTFEYKEPKLTQAQTRLPEIYSIEIRNETYEGEPITDYGEKIYSSETMYLRPRIRYKSYADRSYTFDIKWIKPDGSIRRGDSSPVGYSTSDSYSLSYGEGTKKLVGWGNKTKGNWKSGNYAIEIWCKGTLLKRKEFTIYSRSSSSSSKSSSSSSGHYETCFNCGGRGFLTLYSPYGSYTSYCPGCGGSGKIYIPNFSTTPNWNITPDNSSGGVYVPVNTYSGGYENNNTNNNTINNALERSYIDRYNTLLKNLEYWINDYNKTKNSSYYDPTSSMQNYQLNQVKFNIKDTKEEIRKLRKEAAKDGINIPMSSLENISVN